MTIRKNNGPKRKPIKPCLTQTSATGNTEQTPFTNEQNEERMKKLAAFRPSQARKWGESIFKKAVENDAKAKVEEKATPKVAAKKPVQVQESDRVMRSAYPKDSGNPLDEFKMPKYAENMRRHVSDGRFNDMRSQGVVGLPPPSAFRKMEKSVTKTTDLLGILKTKPHGVRNCHASTLWSQWISVRAEPDSGRTCMAASWR